ncbi:MAG TPA: hypothetical protein VE954_25915 [Oligoflexus sp.]|uniref:hypothetical protein n=1 Tax=Oligoflexus sp. TaxID=1971216 RepID=UPI002D675FCA|nr:hypothetical protein [Oligoflexus sp.]HYX36560.1 hypothetical protein [Oligoflexus sp.]
MQLTAGNNPGIEEFLGHIQKKPSSEVLVERFLVLIMETKPEVRHKAMVRLTHILLEANPHAALQSCYRFLQRTRNHGASIDEEIGALQLTLNCFEKLGKKNQAVVIRDEIERLRVRQENPDSFHRDLRTVLHSTHEQTEQVSYEDLAAELFQRLQTALGNFTNIRHQQLAVQSLIKAYQLVYGDMATPIRKALHLYGRNPLLWTLDGEFRQDLKEYLLEGRLFSMGKDGLSEGRLRMSMELLTGWFDQRLLLPQQSRGKGQELVAQIEFLETALTSIIDRDFA